MSGSNTPLVARLSNARNRPRKRSIIKLFVRLVCGRSRSHVQDWFPGLKLIRATDGAEGRIFYRGKQVGALSRLAQMEIRPASELYIIGSGPSILQSRIELLPPRSCILLNGALHLVADRQLEPLAVAIEDERFVWSNFALMERTIRPSLPCFLSVSVIRAICEHDPHWLSDKKICLIDDIRKPYGQRRRSGSELQSLPNLVLDEAASAGFSKAPDDGVYQGGSVAVSAMQFAVALHPREIGLLGIDISNANEPRFYEALPKEYSGVVKGARNILAHLVLARRVAEGAGVQVVNYSQTSALRDQGFGYSDQFSYKSRP